ncbi:hypothetical protein Tco_0719426 [Tanacetum coccineum]
MSNSNTNLQTQSSNALHNAIMEAGSKDRPPMLAPVPVAEGSSETTTERYMENYKNVSQDIRDQLNAEAEAIQIILTGIDNDIYSTVDACPNACEMWKAIERLKQGESINVQDLETNLYWELENSHHGMFLLQLQPEWQRFVTLVKQSQELKTVSYHKLYDILKQHQNEVNEIRTERLARTANPLALVLRLCRSMGFDVITARNMGMYQGNVRNRNEQRMQLITRKRCYFVNKRKLENWEHIICMAQIHEVTPDAVENSGPFFDVEPLKREQDDQDDADELAQERDLLAF